MVLMTSLLEASWNDIALGKVVIFGVESTVMHVLSFAKVLSIYS